MNNPEYIVVDEVQSLVAKASTELISESIITTAINYQYGYFHEVKAMLAAYSKTTQYSALKFPLFWLVQPFTIRRVDGSYYGETSLRWFLFIESSKGLTSMQRMEQTIKPKLLPIYREIMKQFYAAGDVFDNTMFDHIAHDVTIRPYWGDEQQAQIDEVVDCLEVNGMEIKISNNANCTIETKFSI